MATKKKKEEPKEEDNDAYVEVDLGDGPHKVYKRDHSDSEWADLKKNVEAKGWLAGGFEPESVVKPGDNEEYLEVDLAGDGSRHRIDRGDKSDEAWEKTIKSAQDKGVFKFAKGSEAKYQAKKDEAAAKEDADTLVTAKRWNDDADAREAGRKWDAKIDASKPQIQEKSLASRIKSTANKLLGNDDSRLISEEDLPNDGEGKGGGIQSLIRKTVDEAIKGATPKRSAISVDDMPNGYVEEKDRDALGRTSKTSPAMSKGLGDAFKNAAATEVASLEPTITGRTQGDDSRRAEYEKAVADQASARDAKFAPQPPEGPGVMSTIGRGLLSTVPGIGPTLGAVPEVASAAASALPAVNTSGIPRVDAPPLGAAPQPMTNLGVKNHQVVDMNAPQGASSSGMSMSSRGGSGNALPMMPDRRAALEQSIKDEDVIRQRMAERDQTNQEHEINAQRDAQIHALTMQTEAKQSADRMRDDITAKQKAYAKTVEQIEAPEKVDPSRWWNSRNTAQKIFAVLSAGLTKGASVQMFQQAIDQDIAAQQADISNTAKALDRKASGQMNMIQQAKQNGLDDASAHALAEAQLWGNVEKTSNIAAMTSKSQSVKDNALMQASMAAQKKMEVLTKMDQQHETSAQEREKLRLEARKVSAFERKVAGAGAKEKKGKGLAPKQATDLADLERGKVALEQYQKEVGKPGFFHSMWRKATDGNLPVLGVDVIPWNSEAKDLNAKKKLIIQLIAPGLGSGTLQRDDTKRWDEIMGSAGDLGQAERIDSVLEDVRRTIKSREEGYKKAGYNMEGYAGGPPPTETMSDSDAFGMLEAQ